MDKKVLLPEEQALVSHLELKKAKVPLKTCLKLSLKNMWKKKFRYLVMFLICSLSLTFFSVTIELNGEKLRQNVYTMIENGYRYTDIYEHVKLSEEELKENEYNKYAHTTLQGNSLNTIKDSVDNITIHEYKPVEIKYANLNIENSNYFYTGYINSIIRFDESNNYNLIAGRLPKPNTKEILITDYLAAAFDYFDIYPSINHINDYLNQRLNLTHNNNYIIVGIIKTNYEQWTHFSTVESVKTEDKENYSYYNDFIFMNSVILNDEYFEIEKISDNPSMLFINSNTEEINNMASWTFSVKDLQDETKTIYYGYNEQDEDPTLGSYAISSNNLDILADDGWLTPFGRAPESDDEIVISYKLISHLFGYNWTYTKYRDWYDYRNHQRIWNNIKGKEITITLTGTDEYPYDYEKTYKIVGITNSTQNVSSVNANAVQVSETEYQNIYYTYNTDEEKILVELPNDSVEAYNLFNRALEAGYVIDVWEYQQDIDTYIVDPFLDLASKAGLFIFAIFTMGIMWTIISIEIVDSKKEIGILRSIGLSGGKVSFIFIFQTSVIILLSYFVGVFGGYKLIPLLNNGITDEFGKVTLYLYSFTYRTPLYLALLVIIMTTISTIIPLFKILSQKIIDVINERDN